MSISQEGHSADEQRVGANVHVRFAIDPTLVGVKGLLDGISARLPREAPLAPPRHGQAWQRGFMAGVTQAREMLEWVRDSLQFRESTPNSTASVEPSSERRHSS
jgi:hypothetical protein